MRLTLIHPCIGRRIGQPYIRLWQMEPLPPAVIAGLTPRDIEVKFYDDRMERIPFDEPTDVVGISVETYTAKRAYQIASEYRRARRARRDGRISGYRYALKKYPNMRMLSLWVKRRKCGSRFCWMWNAAH